MEIEKANIDKLADGLAARMKGINDWIKSNPNTDPNFYEIMDCYVEVGQMLSHMSEYYEKEGYPEKTGQNSYTHYEIFRFDEHAKNAFTQLEEMLNLRKSGIEAVLEDVPEIRDMWKEISYRAISAEYEVPQGALARIKKQVLCKSVSIPFYIWQEKRISPDFKYTNANEFDELKEMYDLYKSQCKTPQFGEEIENLIGCIEKSYISEDSDEIRRTR